MGASETAERTVDQQLSSDFKPTAYLKPRTKGELVDILRTMGNRAKIIGGGTGIYELAGRGLLSEVDTLVDVSALGWSYVKKSSRSIVVGATTTMTEMLQSNATDGGPCGAVTDALRAIQPLQVKNVATIGGSICTGLPFFDLPTALLAVGAVVSVGPGDRKVTMDEFLRGYFAVDLAPHEFVMEVEIPAKEGIASAFQKFALTSDDWALVNCGVSLSLDKSGKIREPTLAFGGGVGDRTIRAPRTAAALVGVRARDGDVKAMIDENLPRELQTASDVRASAEYRLELAKVLGRRTTMAACKRGGAQ